MPMSPRLLRPLTGGVHPDAAAWRSAVVANGSSVSASTMRAVSKFCADIDAAGIRDRFYRLNLFCGTDLNACLVPLYRGPSRTGTQYGNATDVNNGPFVGANYSESDGLDPGTGANHGKYLNTGISPDDIGVATGHMSFYSPVAGFSDEVGVKRIMGVLVSSQNYNVLKASSSIDITSTFGANTGVGGALVAGHTLVQRESNVLLRQYSNGVLGNTVTTNITPGSAAISHFIFNWNNAGAPIVSQYWNRGLRGYSLGAFFDSSGVTAYYNAMQAFQTALGRNA
jgi:hypothetical protein